MDTGVILGLAIMTAAPAAQQQDPVTVLPERRVEAQTTAREQQRRHPVQTLEGVLTRAVASGAERVARRMHQMNPNLTLFSGRARARGFILEGYGVFFDVEIPMMLPSVAWAARTMERDLLMTTALDSLRRALAALPEGPGRLQAEQAFKQVQLLGPATQFRSLTMPMAAEQGGVRAANESTVTDARPTPAPPAEPFDPEAAYTEAVQRELIDAMLDYSHPIALQPDEWLTVAARGTDGPLAPGEIFGTLVLRVKGSDLAEYYADRTKADIVRKRVEVRFY